MPKRCAGSSPVRRKKTSRFSGSLFYCEKLKSMRWCYCGACMHQILVCLHYQINLYFRRANTEKKYGIILLILKQLLINGLVGYITVYDITYLNKSLSLFDKLFFIHLVYAIWILFDSFSVHYFLSVNKKNLNFYADKPLVPFQKTIVNIIFIMFYMSFSTGLMILTSFFATWYFLSLGIALRLLLSLVLVVLNAICLSGIINCIGNYKLASSFALIESACRSFLLIALSYFFTVMENFTGKISELILFFPVFSNLSFFTFNHSSTVNNIGHFLSFAFPIFFAVLYTYIFKIIENKIKTNYTQNKKLRSGFLFFTNNMETQYSLIKRLYNRLLFKDNLSKKMFFTKLPNVFSGIILFVILSIKQKFSLSENTILFAGLWFILNSVMLVLSGNYSENPQASYLITALQPYENYNKQIYYKLMLCKIFKLLIVPFILCCAIYFNFTIWYIYFACVIISTYITTFFLVINSIGKNTEPFSSYVGFRDPQSNSDIFFVFVVLPSVLLLYSLSTKKSIFMISMFAFLFAVFFMALKRSVFSKSINRSQSNECNRVK